MIDRTLRDVILSLRPSQISAYLASQGWREDGVIGESAAVWHRTEDESYDFEIILPLKDNLKDYVQRSYDLINVLAKFENRSLRDVVDDLINFHSDVIKIRVVHDDVENGSIPLNDGVLLIEKAKELLISVTKSTFNKRRHFTGGASKEIMDFVETFRLGQTEVGSYIVNLIMPIDRLPAEQGDMIEGSLTRSVTNTLARSLTAIENSMVSYRESQSDQSFESAIEQGVSANLCDALVGLTGENQSRNVNISILLSRADSQYQDIQLQHSFDSGDVEYLKRASDYYKEKYTIHNYTVYGFVTGLKHEENAEFGIVTVVNMVSGREKHINFELPSNEYWQAHQAHGENNVIQCTGDLHVSPRSATLINVSGFSVLGSGNLFDD